MYSNHKFSKMVIIISINKPTGVTQDGFPYSKIFFFLLKSKRETNLKPKAYQNKIK